jgi:hypothetical protein
MAKKPAVALGENAVLNPDECWERILDCFADGDTAGAHVRIGELADWVEKGGRSPQVLADHSPQRLPRLLRDATYTLGLVWIGLKERSPTAHPDTLRGREPRAARNGRPQRRPA